MSVDELKYTIEYDLDRDHVQNIMLQAALRYPGFIPSLQKHGIAQVYRDMLKEMAEKSHEAGMCRDPNCKRDDQIGKTKMPASL